MTNKKWNQHSKNGCEDCNRLNGQVHSEETWENMGVAPGKGVVCGDNCKCTLDETEDTALSERDVTLKLSARPTDDGFFILAINEGEAKGHGIKFSARVLQEAMPLYEAKPVFIDHAVFNAPSVRDLAGTLQDVAWNDENHGIQANLVPAGPAAEVLLSLRDAARKSPAVMGAVGFSSVLNVSLARNGDVLKIVRVKSVDVVIDPARGGKFLSEIHRDFVRTQPLTKGGQTMKRKVKVTDPETQEVTEVEGEAVELSTQEEAIETNRQAAAELLGESQRQAAMQAAMDEQLASSQETLVAMCENLLATGLSNSRLPDLTQARIRKQFAGHVFKAPELALSLQEAREEVSALTAPGNVQGPGRVTNMFDSRDQFRLAVEDLFGVERDPKEANIKVHRLHGIQDAYLMATGDQQFMGGYYPEFALVTANFPGIVANVMNKMLIASWKDLENVYGWWKEIVTIEHFTNLNQVTWVKTGTIASLPSVAERGEYTELPLGDIKETTDWGKYGGYVPLTIEAVLRDDLRAFTHMPPEAALAGIRNVSEHVANVFTQNNGAGPTMSDGGALFNSTAQTTAGGHLNLLTTALGTDYTAWNAVATAMYKKKMMIKNTAGYYGVGKPYGMKPNVCLVPADLITQAEALFIPRWASVVESAVATVGGPSFGGKVKPLAVPDFTDATDWAAVNTLMPGVMLGEIFGVVPQIFSASSDIDPAMFANDESRLKVRQFLAVGVADDMPLAKNHVV